MAKEGVVGVYGPGGYQTSLGQTEYAARKKVAELLRQKWLDQNTRALSIEVSHKRSRRLKESGGKLYYIIYI